MDPPNLNTLGWQVCHVVDIGLNERGPFANASFERLSKHFRLFMHPRNVLRRAEGTRVFGRIVSLSIRLPSRSLV
jgi:hypothetical protein